MRVCCLYWFLYLLELNDIKRCKNEPEKKIVYYPFVAYV